jgi:divalent metal cation (Fe/Co/Zn/Cd) transporter
VDHAHPLTIVESIPAPAPLVHRARLLAQLGMVWHVIEAAVAIGAGAAAGSVALVGFGADSLIEMLAGATLLWRFAPSRARSHAAEHGARRAIALSFFLIAVYVAVEATRRLVVGDHPHASWIGVALAGLTTLAMPPLAFAKRRNAELLHSPAAKGESRQTVLCAYLSIALLAGLLANAVAGWWWADPVAALFIGAVAAREGAGAWRGDASCCEVAGAATRDARPTSRAGRS